MILLHHHILWLRCWKVSETYYRCLPFWKSDTFSLNSIGSSSCHEIEEYNHVYVCRMYTTTWHAMCSPQILGYSRKLWAMWAKPRQWPWAHRAQPALSEAISDAACAWLLQKLLALHNCSSRIHWTVPSPWCASWLFCKHCNFLHNFVLL